MGLSSFLAMTAMLALATPQSQPAPAPTPAPGTEPGKEIVITGRAESPTRTAHRFVQQVVEMDEGPLARFVDPLCIHVSGVPERPTAAISRRLVTVARRAKIRVADAGCTPNLMIFFVVDAESFIKTAKRRDRMIFSQLSEGNRLGATRPGPVRSWRAIEVRDEVGAAIIPGAIEESPPMLEGELSAVTVHAVLVIDRTAAPGKTFIQLADYAAMRMLVGAKAPTRGLGTTDSILSLFDPDATPPPSITAMDLGLLTGLYAGPQTSGDPYHQSRDIARRMTAEPKAGAKP